MVAEAVSSGSVTSICIIKKNDTIYCAKATNIHTIMKNIAGPGVTPEFIISILPLMEIEADADDKETDTSW